MAAMATLEPPFVKNSNYTLMGFEIDENPTYIHVYEFEKQDFPMLHRMLVQSIPVLYAIAGFYLVSIFLLHKWMEKRERYELRKPLFVWNVFLAGLSFIMFARFLPEIIYNLQTSGLYSSYCKRGHINVATMFWNGAYFLSKILEFADTIFIILRKQKLTFLHVFHHASVFIACAYGMIGADPAARYLSLMNTFVHSVMYGYYAFKAAQFKLPRKLAMAVTSVQLLQFATAIVINLLVVYHRVMGSKPHCDRPDDITALYGALAVVYFYLFGDFFLDSYVRRKPVQQAKTKSQ